MTDQGVGLEQALDAALQRALLPPQAPPQLRLRLQAAMAQAADGRLAQAQSLYERAYREQRAELDAQYVRLRHRTLALVAGGAFASGAAATAVLPWLTARLGAAAPGVAVCAGPLLGLVIGTAYWWLSRRESGLPA
jgi:hypothetical protein